MLYPANMSLLPFVLLGLLNGMVVGFTAGLIARAVAPGYESMRFRDVSALGMIGSIIGSAIATALDSQGGYLTSGPSSLLFSVVGAMLVIVLANIYRRPQAHPTRQ